jgi:hypothetical protein
VALFGNEMAVESVVEIVRFEHSGAVEPVAVCENDSKSELVTVNFEVVVSVVPCEAVGASRQMGVEMRRKLKTRLMERVARSSFSSEEVSPRGRVVRVLAALAPSLSLFLAQVNRSIPSQLLGQTLHKCHQHTHKKSNKFPEGC